MTNSIASAKCPSVLTSGKYGMSQRHSIVDDSKEYIFVKLTDSAFRAIEEYQRNAQSKRLQKGQCAKIQFIGNAGVIQFPPTADNCTSNGGGPSDGRKFGFAIDDVEGSLECIQQSGAELDVLGSLSYRMRIHANDDVYDTTRTKMAIAEETEKSKCIREIKPNQTDIGRKVKRAVSAASIHAYTNGITNSSLLNGLTNGSGIGGGSSNGSNVNGSSSYLSNSNTNHISSNSSNSNSRNKLSVTSLNQHSPPSGGASGGNCNSSAGGVSGSRLLSNVSSIRSSPNPPLMGCSGTIGGGNNRFGSPSNISSSLPTLSSNTSNGGGSYSPPSSGNNHQLGLLNSQQKKPNIGNGRGNGGAASKGSLGTNGKVNGISNGKTHDVSRRKIRERLIHLLALKPFKKPELYARLQNEGLAQRERQLISTILKDISTLSRDNTYNLRRSMWNDVDENWPFFSEQEIQQLKRRKPQNLTPPTSSDAGSSMSGQSPTSSVHTGSPPPPTNMNGVGGAFGTKRTSLESDFYDGTLTMGTQSKKQRISHYKKDASSNGGNLINNSNLGAGARTGVGLGANSGGTSYNQINRSSSTSYSPHIYNTGNSNGNDENSGNSDLTFNVLNNMDDFIQHTAVIGGDPTFANRSKTTGNSKISSSLTSGSSCSINNTNNSNNNNVASQMIAKEKRNCGVNNNSNGFGNNRESLPSSNSAMRHKNAKTPYANNFVPENKITSNLNISNNSSRLSKQYVVQKQQRQTSPTYNNSNNLHSHKPTNNGSSSNASNNSVIPNIHEDYSPSLAPPLSQTTNHNANSSSSRSRHHSNASGITNGRSGAESSFLSKHSRPSTPTQKNFNKQHNNSSCKNNLLNNTTPQQLQTKNHNHQTLQQQIEQRQEDQQTFVNDSSTLSQTGSHSTQQGPQQENSSPTQQIAAAASTFSLTNHSSSSGDVPRYDFSSYTPITSIEQRRKYKTEFESDYDEYRKLLAQIESVGHRFRELADRLSRVQQGCSDYYNIKDQIVSEYNRIRKEEAINRDKQRFDYLHEKLAHIKQLVMDYDKKLTSGLVAPTIAANHHHHPQQQQQQQQRESQNQQQHTTVTNSSAHLSPMLPSSGESNHSPPLIIINNTETTNNSLSSFSQSKKSLKHNQKIHQQQQGQQQEHYKQQHYDPETIQMIDDSEEDRYEEETSLQYHHRYDSGDSHLSQQQQQHITPSPANLSHAGERKHQHELQQLPPQQPQSNNNNNDSDSDSDSTSSSSSNDSDDDNSDASDDDNSDDDSNDEDNDDQ